VLLGVIEDCFNRKEEAQLPVLTNIASRQLPAELGNSPKAGAGDRAYIGLSQSVAMRADELVLVHRTAGNRRDHHEHRVTS
jgi:hypothetical protein